MTTYLSITVILAPSQASALKKICRDQNYGREPDQAQLREAAEKLLAERLGEPRLEG